MSEPQPKKKKQRYGSYDKIQQGRNCEMGCCPWGKQQGNLAFLSQWYEELSRTIKKPELKMKNSENFQERIVVQKPFFHPS